MFLAAQNNIIIQLTKDENQKKTQKIQFNNQVKYFKKSTPFEFFFKLFYPNICPTIKRRN